MNTCSIRSGIVIWCTECPNTACPECDYFCSVCEQIFCKDCGSYTTDYGPNKYSYQDHFVCYHCQIEEETGRYGEL